MVAVQKDLGAEPSFCSLSLSFECDAVQSELGAHCQQSAPMEALEPLALADFGKDALHERAAQAVPCPCPALGHYLDHPLLEFFVGVKFEGACVGLRALSAQCAVLACHSLVAHVRPPSAVSILTLLGEQFTPGRTAIKIAHRIVDKRGFTEFPLVAPLGPVLIASSPSTRAQQVQVAFTRIGKNLQAGVSRIRQYRGAIAPKGGLVLIQKQVKQRRFAAGMHALARDQLNIDRADSLSYSLCSTSTEGLYAVQRTPSLRG